MVAVFNGFGLKTSKIHSVGTKPVLLISVDCARRVLDCPDIALVIIVGEKEGHIKHCE
jgi:hypothetical protein